MILTLAAKNILNANGDLDKEGGNDLEDVLEVVVLWSVPQLFISSLLGRGCAFLAAELSVMFASLTQQGLTIRWSSP